jgi:hypothetical protein
MIKRAKGATSTSIGCLRRAEIGIHHPFGRG